MKPEEGSLLVPPSTRRKFAWLERLVTGAARIGLADHGRGAPGSPPPEQDGRQRSLERMSLRTKGLIAFGLLVLYVALVAMVVEQQRQKLLTIVQDLENIHAHDETLGRVSYSVGHAILAVNEAYFQREGDSDLTNIILSGEVVASGISGLAKYFPELAPTAERVERALAWVVRTRSRDSLIDFRESLHNGVAEIDKVALKVRAAKKSLSEGYRYQYDAISLVGMFLGFLGMVAFGGLITLFFTRLAWDIRKLQGRALEVVKGFRGPPMEVTRFDEIGGLMHSVNQMQEALREREARLEISRVRQFHREKMAAVGNLSAAIAHEINNPIAAIAGIAQSITHARQSPPCADSGVSCQPHLILEEARRIAAITRQIADFTRPQSLEAQLLDLNGLVGNTCAFLHYDRRFQSIELVMDLDRELPAVFAVGDHLTQVLMNLLINAADALEGASGANGRRVVITTRAVGEEAILTVADNGKGMDEHIKAMAFEDFFTTKSAGKGSGIGLGLSRRLIREGGGEVELESLPGVGTTVAVRLPLRQPETAGAE